MVLSTSATLNFCSTFTSVSYFTLSMDAEVDAEVEVDEVGASTTADANGETDVGTTALFWMEVGVVNADTFRDAL